MQSRSTRRRSIKVVRNRVEVTVGPRARHGLGRDGLVVDLVTIRRTRLHHGQRRRRGLAARDGVVVARRRSLVLRRDVVVIVLVALGEGKAALLLGDGRVLVLGVERLCGLSAAATAAPTTAATASSAAPAPATAGTLVVAGRLRVQGVPRTGTLVRVVLANFDGPGTLIALDVRLLLRPILLA